MRAKRYVRTLRGFPKVVAICKPDGESSSASLRYGLCGPSHATPDLQEVAAMLEAVGERDGLVAAGGDPT